MTLAPWVLVILMKYGMETKQGVALGTGVSTIEMPDKGSCVREMKSLILQEQTVVTAFCVERTPTEQRHWWQ